MNWLQAKVRGLSGETVKVLPFIMRGGPKKIVLHSLHECMRRRMYKIEFSANPNSPVWLEILRAVKEFRDEYWRLTTWDVLEVMSIRLATSREDKLKVKALESCRL